MPSQPAPLLLFAVTTDLCFDQRMQRICSSLAAAGYRVQLVGWQRPGSPPLTPQPYAQHRLQGWFQQGKLFYLEYNLRLFFYLLSQRAAAWCAADLDTALPVWLRARLGGQPFVYDAHELFTEVPEVVARPAVQRIWRWVEGFIVQRAQQAYTVGPALARVFEQRYGRPFAVVRNVSRLRDELPLPASVPPTSYILYQGALNVGRGLEALLDAMPQVAGRLVICGEGDLSAALRARADKLGLLASGKVEFRGYVLPEALREVTRHAAVGIMLLENIGLSYYYSLANKFFDYVHAGIPQVLIDFPEYRALNEQFDVAELVADLHPTTLATALNRLLRDDPARYQHLAHNCRQAAPQLSWQHEERVLLELYAAVVPLAPIAPRPQ
ncbi:glycosyltransferase [Hymenobacter arizonensis]|uniref:Glycosyltransferase involved in cell wall bisynthesis n=1 Tax=Hymenobacter arizonensis TaxID=1227077 RepID=A0A1I5Z5F4_HYMAR|nr:glycosyltransferase [Hymenobacter arizonensis]SFQ51337.1 Glycosyltransferase involved in cell wall bisynthesis [Hymenobacter arizonensis]